MCFKRDLVTTKLIEGYRPNNPPISVMFYFMGQDQLRKLVKLGKLAVFPCLKRNRELQLSFLKYQSNYGVQSVHLNGYVSFSFNLIFIF